MAYEAHADNIKFALREARDRCHAEKTMPRIFAEVWDRGLHTLTPLKAGLVQTIQGALPLINEVVFLIEEARLGVVRVDGPGYMSLTSEEFTRDMAKGTENPEEAYEQLNSYFQAIRQLP